MTTGNDARAAQLMQDGIKLVKEGRGQEAYQNFKEVTEREPNNEFAWIWISVTSRDYDERRTALERALQINPSSSHAREALRNLEIEVSRMQPPPPPVVEPTFVTQNPPPPPRLGMVGSPVDPRVTNDDPLASLRDRGDTATIRPSSGGRKGRDKTRTTVVTTGTRRRGFSPVARLLIFTLTLVLLAVVGYYVYTNYLNKPADPAPAVADVTTTATTTDTAGVTTPATVSIASPGTVTLSSPVAQTGTPAALTVAAATSPTTVISPAAGVTTPPVTTSASGSPTAFANIGTPSTVTTGTRTPSTASTAVTTNTAPTGTTTVSGTASSSPVAGTTAPATTSAAATPPATTAATQPTSASGGAATTTTTGQIDRLLQTSRQSVGSGDYKAAISAITDALRLDPNSVSANLELGSVYMRAPNDQLGANVNRYDEAIRSFSRVTQLVPSWPGGFARLGEAQAAKGDLAKAIAAYNQSLQLDPNGSERWLALAELYDKNSQPTEAGYARDRARGVVPTTAPPAAPATPR